MLLKGLHHVALHFIAANYCENTALDTQIKTNATLSKDNLACAQAQLANAWKALCVNTKCNGMQCNTIRSLQIIVNEA